MSLPDFGKAIRFFQFGYRAYRPRFAELKYKYSVRRDRIFRGVCELVGKDVGLSNDLVALLATGTGLMLMRHNTLYRLCESMGYMFGMTILGNRAYLLHLIQTEGNYKHTEETFRQSEIYSIPVDQLMQVQIGDRLDLRREYSEQRVLYSHCNTYDGRLYVIDYLGRLSVFEVDEDGRLDVAGARHVMMNRHLDGTPLRNYAYTHYNSISIAGNKIFVGAHGRKAHSGQFSSVYSIDLDLDPASIRFFPTPFVHAHDMLIANGDFYACDSRNGILIRNERRLFVDREGFMRGLSVLKDRCLIGQSVKSDRRGDRNREVISGNQLVELDKDGAILGRAELFSSQIYSLMVLSEPDYTVSVFGAGDETQEAPDVAAIMASGEACDVVTYYSDETPPFHGNIRDY